MKISDDMANVLGNSQVDGDKLYLPPEQLDRKLYVAVNKVLEAIGGKWNRKAKAHLFGKPIQDILDEILLTGQYVDAKAEYQFFETPEKLARELVTLADIHDEESCLEPSAGMGAIARYMPNPDCIDLNPDNREYLIDHGFKVVSDDFLHFSQPYNVIVGNPPFSRQQDISHVTHMVELARRRVVSVMSASIKFRTNRKTLEFRELLDRQNGEIIDLPEGSFGSSGTNVNACVIVCDGAVIPS